MIFWLSVVVAKNFGGNEHIDIFTWTVFFIINFQGWLFGTFSFTVIPILGNMTLNRKKTAIRSLIWLVICTAIFSISLLAPFYENLFHLMTKFSEEVIHSFSIGFKLMCLYFLTNSLFEVIEIKFNERKSFIIPAILRGIVNPAILIIVILYFSLSEIEEYALIYFLGNFVAFIILALKDYLDEKQKPKSKQFIDYGFYKSLFLRGYPIFLGQLINSIGEFLLRFFLTGSSIGTLFFYSIAKKLADAINSLFIQTIVKIGFVEISQISISENNFRNNTYGLMIKSVYFFCVFASSFLLIISETLVTSFYTGGDITPANTQLIVDIFQILIIGLIPHSLGAFNWKVLSYLDATKIGMYLGLPLSIVTGYSYYKASTILGLAYAEVIMAFLHTFIYGTYTIKKLGFKITQRDIIFIIFTPILCFLSADMIDSITSLFLDSKGVIYLFTIIAFSIPTLYVVANLMKKITPFAFSDLKRLNPY